MRPIVLSILLTAAAASPSAASPHYPGPPYSTATWRGPFVGACSQPVVCPGGDAPAVIDVVAKDPFNSPIAYVDPQHASVTGTCALASGSPCGQVIRIYADGPSDALGRMTITVGRAGGCCATLSAEGQSSSGVWVPFATLSYVSPDATGDLSVGLADLTVLAASFNRQQGDGAYNTCVDFNCDGVVGLSDLSIFAGHYGHACP